MENGALTSECERVCEWEEGWTVKVLWMQPIVICVFDLVRQLFKRLDQDEVQTATANVRKEFHYSKVGIEGHGTRGSGVTPSRWTPSRCTPSRWTPSRSTLYINFFILSPLRLGAAEEAKGY